MMNWKLKARIQSMVARLPDRVSYALYYQLQRRLGGLRSTRINPTSRMQFGIDVCKQIVAAGGSPSGATFFEVGTGWQLNLPIACWLLGAERVTTVDLNPYLKIELVREDLHYLRKHREAVADRFERALPEYFRPDRFEELLATPCETAEQFCEEVNITYLAPADARHIPLPDSSIDYHVSCNVLEHIPRAVLQGIWSEANRIVRPEGLLVHRVDHSDHFSHSDGELPAINFLRYSDDAWRQLAGNRYAYVNRLREDDYLDLLAEAKQTLVAVLSDADPLVSQQLASGLPIDPRFAGKSFDTLARLESLLVARPASATAADAA